MNNKILIGSIIAVVILVLVSFTGVVGYQNTKSTITRASPLFSVRIKRAIDEDSKDIAYDYIGKGEEIKIHLSNRMRRAEQAQKAVSIISNMNDRTFSRFIGRIILNLKYQEKMTSTEIIDVLQALNYIKESPNVMKYYDTENNPIDDTSEYVSCRWYPGCNILDILVHFIGAIIGTITYLLSCYHIPSVGCCYPPK